MLVCVRNTTDGLHLAVAQVNRVWFDLMLIKNLTMQRNLLLKIPIIKRLYPSLLLRLLKLFYLNRRVWRIKKFRMCLDFLDSVGREIILKNEYEPKQIDYFYSNFKISD